MHMRIHNMVRILAVWMIGVAGIMVIHPAMAQTVPPQVLKIENSIAAITLGAEDALGQLMFGTTGGNPDTVQDDDTLFLDTGGAFLYVEGVDGEIPIASDGIMVEAPHIDLNTQSGGWIWKSTDENAPFTVEYRAQLIRDVVRWEYHIKSLSPQSRRIGFRVWQKLHYPDAEGGPYYFPGTLPVTTSQEFVGSKVPSEFLVRYNPADFTPEAPEYKPLWNACIPLSGNNITIPERFVVSTEDDVSTYGWVEILDALLPENWNQPPYVLPGQDLTGSMGVDMIYSLKTLAYNEERVIRGEYRFNWAQVRTFNQYALSTLVPEWIGYREGDDPDTTDVQETYYYKPSVIDVRAFIFNASKIIQPSATVTIDLGDNMTLVSGSSSYTAAHILGLEDKRFLWRVRVKNGATGLLPIRITATLTPGGTVVNTAYISAPALPSRIFSPGLRFVGFPYTFTNPDANYVLSGGLDDVKVDLAWYDPLLSDYRYASNDNISLQPGRGYWWRLNANSALLPDAKPLDQRQTSWVALSRGWNAISNPYLFSILWGYCHVYANGKDYTIEEAIKNGMIRRELWSWDTGNGEYAPPTNPYPWYSILGELKPFEAYWIYATESVQLVYTPNPFLAPMDPNTPDARDYFRTSATTGEWRVNLIAETNAARDRFTTFGVAENELDGFSDGDMMKPPVSPTGLSAYFARKTWGRASGNYAIDMQAPGTKKSWPLNVLCTKANQTVTLRWPDLTQVPPQVPLMLKDELTGRMVAMRTSLCYTFNSGAGGTRAFTITAGGTQTRLQLTQPVITTNKAQRGCMINYSLSMPASVKLRVTTLNGRVMFSGDLGQRESGQHSESWNGRDQLGRLVPGGIFVCELYAEAQDGQRVRGMATVRAR